MAHVKADRRGATWTTPDMVGGNRRDQTLEIFSRLNECVDGRHQQRLEPGDGSSLPGFGWNGGHLTTVPAHANAARYEFWSTPNSQFPTANHYQLPTAKFQSSTIKKLLGIANWEWLGVGNWALVVDGVYCF